MRLRSLALALALLPLAGCPWLFGTEEGGDEGPPCEGDLSGCDDDTSKFMEDPSCTLEGDLELQLGQGETEFSALDPGEMPEIHYGFQGGQHVWMAVQVKNPDLERKQLKIQIKLDYCNSDCEQPSAWVTDNVRELVADETTMRITPEGWIEQIRMLVTIYGWVEASNRRVEMVVSDPCGRQGVVTSTDP